jgi:5-formyltetrahydrofolate cyclo-ligase
MEATTSKPALRRLLRQRRRSLTGSQQKTAATALTLRILNSDWFHHSRHIAFYLANDGEIDPALLLATALEMGKQCYLPRIVDLASPHMVFGHYRRGDRLTKNSFGIAEPLRHKATLLPQQLDLVLLPLVGFDANGGRLGMGGGFYDRSLAFKLQQPKAKPRLIGLAHELQRVDELENNSWDVPLDGVATDSATYDFRFSRCRRFSPRP